MRYRVVISERAREQLRQQVRFLARVNRPAAARLKERLLAALRSLEEMPGRYPFLNEPYLPANKYHKLYVENWYLALYQIRDDTVLVDWIIDCRSEPFWLPK